MGREQDQDTIPLQPGSTIYYRIALILAQLVDQWFFVLALFFVLMERSMGVADLRGASLHS